MNEIDVIEIPEHQLNCDHDFKWKSAFDPMVCIKCDLRLDQHTANILKYGERAFKRE